MASNKDPQGFEVAEYSEKELDAGTAYGVIRQIFFDRQKASPAWGVWADMAGDQLKVHYHSYEMFLPQRIKAVEDQAQTALKEAVKYIREEFRARTGRAIKLVEQKDLAGDVKEKVSLNERYYYRTWKCYTVSF